MDTFVVGGGCFWCIDAVFRRLAGVTSSICGYAGGTTTSPAYSTVGSGTTGHAEVVKVTFDETLLPPETLLDIFFLIHNPTTLNRQGADEGSQYRSIMLYADNIQKAEFTAAIERAERHWDIPIVTELAPLNLFYPAEPEHQDYFSKHPDAGYCQIIITPKLTKVRAAFTKYLKEGA